jgi:hypothetical protein
MHSDFEINSDLHNTVSNYYQALASFDELQSVFEQIDSHLANPLWSGESQQRCIHAHDAIKQYAALIRPLCEELLTNMADLGSNADSFVTESDKVALIRQI